MVAIVFCIVLNMCFVGFAAKLEAKRLPEPAAAGATDGSVEGHLGRHDARDASQEVLPVLRPEKILLWESRQPAVRTPRLHSICGKIFRDRDGFAPSLIAGFSRVLVLPQA